MKSFEEVVIEIGMENLQMELNRWDTIDNKALGVVGIAGLLTTLWTFLNMNPLFLLPLIAAIFCSLACLWVRGTEMLSTQFLIDDFKDEEHVMQLRRTARTIAKVERCLRIVCARKAWWLRLAFIFLAGGLILLIFSFLV